jgi:hypothetical protein
MVHVPAATIVTVTLDTVHTAGVVEAKLTARPEDAVPLTVNGALPWVLMSRDPAMLNTPGLLHYGRPIVPDEKRSVLWTDDFSNPLPLLRFEPADCVKRR